MISVIFVCLGNICRSPMAEAIFRDLVKREGLQDQITIDSAGTGDWHIGHPPHEGTREILKKNQVTDEGIFARQIAADDLNQFDYIIAMDSQNIDNIRKVGKIADHVKINKLLIMFRMRRKRRSGSLLYRNFDEVYELVQAGCTRLLEEIKKELSLKEKTDE